MNNRRKLVIALGAAAFAPPLSSLAQPATKVWRIGYMTGRKGRPDPTLDTLLQALRELGYVEGKNVQLEYRAVGNMPKRTASIAAELVQLTVDVIFSPTFATVLAAKQATRSIPIVGVIGFDPVEGGLADSLARPGGNFTGIARLTRELSGKRLELIKDMIPGVARVGILFDPNEQVSPKAYEVAARALNLQLLTLGINGPNPDLESAFQAMTKAHVQAFIPVRSPLILSYARQIADLAIKHRLPLICEGSEFTDAGGIVSYQTNDTESFKRAAWYIDKILKGARPGDLPIEQPTRFELIINMKTAKAIGITIPHSLLQRVDKLIE